MSLVAVIGEALQAEGYALAGAMVIPAEDAAQARAAIASLPADVAVVVLTARAAEWLGEESRSRPGLLLAVMPG